ncbi:MULTISPECIES: DUF6509 family protein [Bacillus]|uniref:DUF6509 family protein n=1 Tax=Bacillus TaxID=1386 RepID=UPI000305D462|nr:MULTISPECIES: DUF6509 family protein [Bacillus]
MITITEYEIQLINDQFGILPGNRYEFLLYLDVPEDDELHHENGVYAKVIFLVDGDKEEILTYDLFERSENTLLDFELEDDEISVLNTFCKDHYSEEM